LKALIHDNLNKNGQLCIRKIPDSSPKKNEVKIKIKVAGLNRRDLFVMKNRDEEEGEFIPGSDGAGVIVEVGSDIYSDVLNQEVIINPTLNWERSDDVPISPDILGGPTNGTFAEYVTVPFKNVVQKPRQLSWEEAGTLGLSAVTAYRALFTKGKLKSDEIVLIPGIGGGVATFAMQFAKAVGAKVIVTSRHSQTLKKAQRLGADITLNSNIDWKDALGDTKVDLILDSIGPATFSKYLEIIKPNGRIVCFGASSGDSITLPLRSLFYPQIQLIGTSMGSTQEFEEMIHFVMKHSISTVTENVYPFEEAKIALEHLENGVHFGNIGLAMY
jgi:zinc-binding alcohol dehydrogenase/oxidoreductase